MSANLQRAAKSDEIVRACVVKSSHEEMREGSVYIDKKGVYHKILSLTLEKQRDWTATEQNWRKKHGEDKYFLAHEVPKKDIVMVDDVRVKYISMEEDDEWGHECSFLLHGEARKVESWVLVRDQEKYERLAVDIISGKEKLPDPEATSANDASNDALIHVKSKEYLISLQEVAKEKAQHFMLVQHHVQRNLEKQKAHLAGIVNHFHQMVATLNDQVRRIQKIIDVIELYLGINETILQIQEGPLAPADAPVTFRQKVMFMDEEVGDPRLDKWGRNEGLDFRNIDAFDSWLCTNGNYKKVIPEEKCVCVFKVRRHDKDGHWQAAGGNPFIAHGLLEKDKKTYILVRNGDNLYRIWTDLEVGKRLFPHRNELLDLQKQAQADPKVWHDRSNITSPMNQHDENREKHGPWEHFWPNGNVEFKGSYEHGKEHGPWEHFHINGKLWRKGSYQHGTRHGPWEIFYEDGTLCSKGSYEHGQRHGPWEFFWKNGKLWQKGSYENDMKKGTWIEQWNQQ